MSIVDAKYAIWRTLHDAYKELNEQHPDKIDVKVTMAYPRTVEEIDKRAIITVARINAPEETRFVSDLLYEELQTNEMQNQRGTFQTDIFEVAIWTLDPQYRDDLYLLTRQLLFEKKKTELLEKFKFIKFYRIGGSDQELDVAKLPRTIYRAVLTYLTTTQLEYQTLYDLVEQITVSTLVVTGDIV